MFRRCSRRYTLLARNDSSFQSGGVGIFILDSLVAGCSRVLISESAEIAWILIHCNCGPVLLACWYRRPCYNETDSIRSLGSEWAALRDQCIGTVIVGDMNIHHRSWLQFSHSVTPEGMALKIWVLEHGFPQRVRKPTRGEYLLDLVFIGMPS